jgi:hypothetical protein
MLLSIALCLLAAEPAAQPKTTVEHAGFLRDARVEIAANHRLSFDARIQWPVTITRKSFVVEGLAADGAVLFSRSVTAEGPTPTCRHKRDVHARFALDLPTIAGVEQVRVRLAK